MNESNPYADGQIDVNPYAAPLTRSQPAQSLDGIWRDGDTLIIHKQAVLPSNICIKSNEGTDGYRLKRKLSWYPPWIGITVLISPLIFILLAALMSKRATIYVSLNQQWRGKRRSRIVTGWVLFLMGLSATVGGIHSLSNPAANDAFGAWLLFGGILLVIAAAIFALIASRLVSPKRIDKDYLYLKGAHPEFLDRFPHVPLPQ